MRLLIWDFDGTLGYRESGAWAGGAWTAALLEVLEAHAPERDVTQEALCPYTRTGFRWHRPATHHAPVADASGGQADAWWAELEPVFARAYAGVGLPGAEAWALARRVRSTYVDLRRWHRYDDVAPMLARLAAAGWTHVMLTNHVPELSAIVGALSLTDRFARIFNSARTGYEKPNPRAFELVLEAFPEAGACWMVGDSYQADVLGAQAVGLPAVLVRRPHPEARHYAETLPALLAILANGER